MTRSIVVVLSRRQRNDSLDAGSTVASMGPMRIVMAGFIACFGLGCGSDPLPGRDGTQGLPGRDGVQGPDGTLGAVGAAGSQGAVGPKGNPGLGGPVDGSRLKAMYRKGEDGSRDYTGSWWDSMLAVECSYQRASDGVERCLPAMTKIVQIAYLDAACAVPVFEALAPVVGCAADSPAAYGYKSDPACATSTHIYSLGSSVAPATPRYFITNGGPCAAAGNFDDAVVLARAMGAEIPAASFVGAAGMHD